MQGFLRVIGTSTSTVCSTCCAVLCHDFREVPNLFLALWKVPLNRLRHLLVLDILLDGCRQKKNQLSLDKPVPWKCLTMLLILSVLLKIGPRIPMLALLCQTFSVICSGCTNGSTVVVAPGKVNTGTIQFELSNIIQLFANLCLD